MRWRPSRFWEVRLSGQDRRRDARGDLGDRILRSLSGRGEVLLKPWRGVQVSGSFSREVETAKVRYELDGRSFNRLSDTRSALSASWGLSGGTVLFLQGDHRRLETRFQGLVSLGSEDLFFGPAYSERTTSVQAGASLPLGARWHASLFGGQTLLSGTQSFRFPVLSATVDFDWKPGLSVSLRGQASGFHRYAYSFENGSADFVSAVLSWKF
ncbi:MAG: hypothetical protein ACP5VN_10105 [Acidobacteriota bacterium]